MSSNITFKFSSLRSPCFLNLPQPGMSCNTTPKLSMSISKLNNYRKQNKSMRTHFCCLLPPLWILSYSISLYVPSSSGLPQSELLEYVVITFQFVSFVFKLGLLILQAGYHFGFITNLLICFGCQMSVWPITHPHLLHK